MKSNYLLEEQALQRVATPQLLVSGLLVDPLLLSQLLPLTNTIAKSFDDWVARPHDWWNRLVATPHLLGVDNQ